MVYSLPCFVPSEIVKDSYSDVKSTTSSMTTLNTQISEMLRRRFLSARAKDTGHSFFMPPWDPGACLSHLPPSPNQRSR